MSTRNYLPAVLLTTTTKKPSAARTSILKTAKTPVLNIKAEERITRSTTTSLLLSVRSLPVTAALWITVTRQLKPPSLLFLVKNLSW